MSNNHQEEERNEPGHQPAVVMNGVPAGEEEEREEREDEVVWMGGVQPDLMTNPVNLLIVRQFLVNELRARGHAWSMDNFNINLPVGGCRAAGDEDQPDGQNRIEDNQQPADNPANDDIGDLARQRENVVRISDALASLAREHRARGQGPDLAGVANQIELTEDNLTVSLHTLANELFTQGIKWNYIATFFAFCSELAHQLVTSGRSHFLVPLSVAMTNYLESRLWRWIDGHGGWEQLVQYAHNPPGETRDWQPSLGNVFCAGIGLVVGFFMLLKH